MWQDGRLRFTRAGDYLGVSTYVAAERDEMPDDPADGYPESILRGFILDGEGRHILGTFDSCNGLRVQTREGKVQAVIVRCAEDGFSDRFDVHEQQSDGSWKQLKGDAWGAALPISVQWIKLDHHEEEPCMSLNGLWESRIVDSTLQIRNMDTMEVKTSIPNMAEVAGWEDIAGYFLCVGKNEQLIAVGTDGREPVEVPLPDYPAEVMQSRVLPMDFGGFQYGLSNRMIYYAALSPDGKTLATLDANWILGFWKMPSLVGMVSMLDLLFPSH